MADAAEGVWLDLATIHPIAPDCTIGNARFK